MVDWEKKEFVRKQDKKDLSAWLLTRLFWNELKLNQYPIVLSCESHITFYSFSGFEHSFRTKKGGLDLKIEYVCIEGRWNPVSSHKEGNLFSKACMASSDFVCFAIP